MKPALQMRLRIFNFRKAILQGLHFFQLGQEPIASGQGLDSKYPPAEPGALVREPLEAALRGR